VDSASEYLLENGVTSFCPTFTATPLDELDGKLKNLFSCKSNFSKMLGAHLEGPFISLRHKGAQPAENIRSEYSDADASFFSDNADKITIVTLCPAVKNAPKLVSLLTELKIKVQGGHDDSALSQILDCMKEGLDGVTHIYCGCSSSERDKNFDKTLALTEAGLYYDELTVEAIADGKHLKKELFLFVLKNKGFKNVCIISDSLAPAGMPNGRYKLGDQDVYTDGVAAYLSNGTSLAGSISNLAAEVKNVVGYGVPLEQAVYMAADAPLKYLGLNSAPAVKGEKADFNLLSEDGNLLAVYYGNYKSIK
jgi:N-acetylglucosamine-6-phosphate deacetylase